MHRGKPRIAIVHDYLTQFGGAERVLLALMELFPQAVVHTLLYDPPGLGTTLPEDRLKISWLQRVPGAKRHHRYFPLLMPLAAESFDFSRFDIVISDTHSFGKGVITGPQTLHLSYCFTPTRYVWDDCHRYIREFSRLAFFQKLAPVGLAYIRLWDYLASQRVDQYLTLSHFVARRIKKYYGREAIVIPPPVDVTNFSVSQEKGEYYLIVSRLVPYKRIDLAIDACEQLGRPLKIVGVGPEQPLLAEHAGQYTQFLGFVPDTELASIYQGAKALLFPQEEDFGLTPLEAAASGKPTIAFAAGGALETVIHGETGLLFEEQTVASLTESIVDFEKRAFNPVRIRQHAESFSRESFLRAIEQTVHTQWMAYRDRFTTRL
jgi:glycosyltransferase involved in cell wall biosynthesis